MSTRKIRGRYISGLNHSPQRPKFFASLGLWQGTINIEVPAETDEDILIPVDRVRGLDPIDVEQDLLIRPCLLKGVSGYQILPIIRSSGQLQGHHQRRVIEISPVERIELQAGEELEVELSSFED